MDDADLVPPEAHHDHRDVTGGGLRAAVFGVMDGLVSTGALIAGVAGAGAPPRTVALAGVAGAVAGAVSMATGEYTSVVSQRELTQAEIAIEKAEIRRVPKAEEAELAAMYRAKGLDSHLARQVAAQLSVDPDQTWRVHAREELGVDPDDLPSPWTAAGASLLCFSLGALVPTAPYLLGASSLGLAMTLTALALFLVGVLVSRFTTRSWWWSGARQLLLGALAAAVTFVVGSAFGVGLN